MADKKISQLTGATLPLGGTEVLPIVQSGSTKNVATNDLTVKNVRSNATTGVLQVAGPAAGSTRVMTTPDANFTTARSDAAQTLTGLQTIQVTNRQPQLKLERTGTFAGSGVMYANQFVSFAVGNGSVDQFFISQSAAAGALEITSDSNLKVLAGKGIDFSATGQAGGMTSELLDDYEEGTWTPALVFDNAMSGAFTYTTQAGTYTKVGRLVTARFRLEWTAVPSAGQIMVMSLPFTAVNAANVQGFISAQGGITNTGTYTITGGDGLVVSTYIATQCSISTVKSGGDFADPLQQSALTSASGNLAGVIVYEVA